MYNITKLIRHKLCGIGIACFNYSYQPCADPIPEKLENFRKADIRRLVKLAEAGIQRPQHHQKLNNIEPSLGGFVLSHK